MKSQRCGSLVTRTRTSRINPVVQYPMTTGEPAALIHTAAIEEHRITYNSAMSFEPQLAALYSEQLQIKRDPYLHAHSRNRAVIKRHVSIFERYSAFIPQSGSILDWGCYNAPDACLVKMLRGDAVQLYGCDVFPQDFSAFHNFANLRYTQITDPYRLPYEENSFDAVIGSGVLEHVPNDSESLTELYRIVKPGGHLIVTMLPNQLSYTEFLNRRLKNPHHLRLYSLTEAKRMLIHHGFLPVTAGYHQVFPALSSPSSGIFDSKIANSLVEGLASCNEIGEKLWPFRCFATNIFLVGKKVTAFHG
jgi:SAM-dependent methyltransferase